MSVPIHYNSKGWRKGKKIEQTIIIGFRKIQEHERKEPMKKIRNAYYYETLEQFI